MSFQAALSNNDISDTGKAEILNNSEEAVDYRLTVGFTDIALMNMWGIVLMIFVVIIICACCLYKSKEKSNNDL